MRLVEKIHERYIFGRRIGKLAAHFARVIPLGARVLDVGCGDGALARLIMKQRPDVKIDGIDVLIREKTHISVQRFDGHTIPYPSGAFELVMFADVLHHTADPEILLREAIRVCSDAIVLKDHTAEGLLAHPTLRFMDKVGNARHGINLPFNYWTETHWLEVFRSLGLNVSTWIKQLGLYPLPVNWLFGRSLHFLAVLSKSANPSPCHSSN